MTTKIRSIIIFIILPFIVYSLAISFLVLVQNKRRDLDNIIDQMIEQVNSSEI